MMQRADYPTVQGPLIGVYISSSTTFEMYFVYLQARLFLGFEPTVPIGHAPADFSVPGRILACPGISVLLPNSGSILTDLN